MVFLREFFKNMNFEQKSADSKKETCMVGVQVFDRPPEKFAGIEIDFLNILYQNICCGYSKEPSQIKINFPNIHNQNNILWVFKRTGSIRRFFRSPRTYV